MDDAAEVVGCGLVGCGTLALALTIKVALLSFVGYGIYFLCVKLMEAGVFG